MSVIIAINRVSTRYYKTLDDCNKSFEYFLILESDIYVHQRCLQGLAMDAFKSVM